MERLIFNTSKLSLQNIHNLVYCLSNLFAFKRRQRDVAAQAIQNIAYIYPLSMWDKFWRFIDNN